MWVKNFRVPTFVIITSVLGLHIACEAPPEVDPTPDAPDVVDPDPIDPDPVDPDIDPVDPDPVDPDPVDPDPVDPDPVDPDPVDPDPVDPDPTIAEQCFSDMGGAVGPEYDQFNPTVASHCLGTDHQDISGVERVVFIGDSVTVGSPPTPRESSYRSQLADMLAAEFNLEAPGQLWRSYDFFNGTPGLQDSGDFSACAKWGARTDDLMRDGTQIEDCFPEDKRHLRTLVVMTMGGNDVAALTQDFAQAPYEDALAFTVEFIDLLEDAVTWLKEPGRFPNGVSVVFGNLYEFTDGTGDTSACPATGLASIAPGLGDFQPWDNPADLETLMIFANEQYMRIAAENDADMILMLETFCGHGYKNEDPSTRCYDPNDNERWFDLSCIHPNPAGHGQLAHMFFETITE
jgi:lysophospholipase L1-like esterase